MIMESGGPNLSALLRRGGIFYHAPGKLSREILTWLVDAIPARNAGSEGIDKDLLLKAVLEREDLMPTAMGNGIALPHPRNPVIEKEEDQFAALAFPENAIDWAALDGKPVTTVILAVSASARMHLSTLQRITFFCRDGTFCALLARRAAAEEIFAYIEKTEAGWGST
jgi:PTS system nitrogen regulatory IIA component